MWRVRAFQRQQSLGIVPPGTVLPARNEAVPEWTALDADQRRLALAFQEAFAAMLESVDAQIGRVLAELDRLGQRENTLVVLLSLAIGIGATTALFTAVNGLLLQTIPVRAPSELAVLKWTGKNDMVRSSSDYGFSQQVNGQSVRSTFSYATYQQLKAANQTTTDLIAGTSLEGFNFASNGTSEIATAFGVLFAFAYRSADCSSASR